MWFRFARGLSRRASFDAFGANRAPAGVVASGGVFRWRSQLNARTLGGRGARAMNFLKPWRAVGSNAPQLQKELAAELGPDHPLKGRDLRAVAVRQDCHDVLFVSSTEPQVVAVVHLTYANRPESDPRWPETTLFESIQDWMERGMKADHDDFFS
jgi:hypothetical protein